MSTAQEAADLLTKAKMPVWDTAADIEALKANAAKGDIHVDYTQKSALYAQFPGAAALEAMSGMLPSVGQAVSAAYQSGYAQYPGAGLDFPYKTWLQNPHPEELNGGPVAYLAHNHLDGACLAMRWTADEARQLAARAWLAASGRKVVTEVVADPSADWQIIETNFEHKGHATVKVQNVHTGVGWSMPMDEYLGMYGVARTMVKLVGAPYGNVVVEPGQWMVLPSHAAFCVQSHGAFTKSWHHDAPEYKTTGYKVKPPHPGPYTPGCCHGGPLDQCGDCTVLHKQMAAADPAHHESHMAPLAKHCKDSGQPSYMLTCSCNDCGAWRHQARAKLGLLAKVDIHGYPQNDDAFEALSDESFFKNGGPVGTIAPGGIIKAHEATPW